MNASWFRGDHFDFNKATNGVRIDVGEDGWLSVQYKHDGQWHTQYGVGTEQLQSLNKMICESLVNRAQKGTTK